MYVILCSFGMLIKYQVDIGWSNDTLSKRVRFLLEFCWNHKYDALQQEDDGGGMDPEIIRQCMSFGFSDKKSKSAIGQCMFHPLLVWRFFLCLAWPILPPFNIS